MGWEMYDGINMYRVANIGDYIRFDYSSRAVYEVIGKSNWALDVKYVPDGKIYRQVQPTLFTLIRRREVGME